MTYKPFYISNYEKDSGLFTYNEPFLIPEKAFPVIEDAYVWRGKVRRRKGNELLGRLRRVFPMSTPASIGDISAAGAGDVTVNIVQLILANLSPPDTNPEPHAQLESGDKTTIIITIAAPIDQTLTDSTGTGVMTISGSGSLITAATINYATGDLKLTFSGVAAASAATFQGAYYPSLSTTGCRTRNQPALNQEQTVFFDQKYAYIYDPTIQKFKQLADTANKTWNSRTFDLMWTLNYWYKNTNILFWATNFNSIVSDPPQVVTPDPIRYYDGTLWTDFAPTVSGSNKLQQCLCLVAYKGRMLAFNTFEGTALNTTVHFPQRVRWSQSGDPTQSDAWDDTIVGKGGYLDASTTEDIIGVEFVKDTLLVKFESSSWRLTYTGNELLPFVFQKINTELGSSSTFSLIPFDRAVFCVGNLGITSDDSVNVTRIDELIPDQVFKISNYNSGLRQVYGIRDYYEELVYWTYPYNATNALTPDQCLVYNYRNGAYSVFNDFYTCFGYFQPTADKTWAELTDFTWEQWLAPWNSSPSLQKGFPDVVAGNQQGFISLVMQDESILNKPTLAISAIAPGNPVVLTVYNHNLQDLQVIKITGIIGSGSPSPAQLNNGTYFVNKIDSDHFSLQVWDNTSDPPNFSDVVLFVGGAYIGNGVIALHNNIQIQTKVFSPFYDQGSQCRLGYVDFLLNRTANGEVICNLYIDECDSIAVNDQNSAANSGLIGTNILLTRPENTTLVPYQANQSKIWHRLYVSTISQNFQFKIAMDANQMSQESIAGSDFVLHAMVLYLTQNARLIQ